MLRHRMDKIMEKIENKSKNNYDDILREKYPKLEQLKSLRWSPFYYQQSKQVKRAINFKLKTKFSRYKHIPMLM